MNPPQDRTLTPNELHSPKDSPSTTPEAASSDTGTLIQKSSSTNLSVERSFDLPEEYEFLGELGRGGMGVVYKAKHKRLNRIVALKMILSGGHAGQEELDRFYAEAEAVASLAHRNIVQIFDIGQHRGLPFFTLEFVSGGSLANKIKVQSLDLPPAIQLIEEIAQGMGFAHEKGIIHRDLKPENILLTEDGIPKITDFGLAKRIETQGITRTGAVMGTPSYMAPEQAGGETKSVGPEADVYALGAILYRLIAGRPPFEAPTTFDTLSMVIHQQPTPPQSLNTNIPKDLNTIVLKCLEKSPTHRYPTAIALADDLHRYLNGEPILARPISRAERGFRWVNRNRTFSLVVGGIGLALLLGIFLGQRRSPSEVPQPPLQEILPQEDVVVKWIEDLNRTDPGWRMEQLEAKRAVVPANRNSATIIPVALAKQPSLKKQLLAGIEKNLTDWRQQPLTTSLTATETKQMTALLKPFGNSIQEGMKLKNYPQGRHSINWTRDGFTTQMPHSEGCTVLANILLYHGIHQLALGNRKESFDAILATLHIGRSLQDEYVAISQLVRIAVTSFCCTTIERFLALAEPEPDLLSSLLPVLTEESRADVAQLMMKAERGMIHWTFGTITSGDFDPKVFAEWIPEKEKRENFLRGFQQGTKVRPAHAYALQKMTELVEIAKLPTQEQSPKAVEWNRDIRSNKENAEAKIFLPAGEKLFYASLLHKARTRLTILALEMEIYRQTNGQWPQSLDELRTDVSKEIRTDPFTGKPFLMKQDNKQITLYSVGENGKNDNGDASPDPGTNRDRDIVFRLYNPEVRGSKRN